MNLLSSARTAAADFEDALQVCPIILGGPFGEESFSLTARRLGTFVERGGTVVETAHSYAAGQAETAIGRWCSARSAPELTIITKIGHPDGDGVSDMSPETLHDQARCSRERLGVAALDVVLLHRDEPERPVDTLFETMRGLVENGFARRYGISNWGSARAREFVGLAVAAGDTPVLSYQYSLAVPAGPIWPGTRHLTDELSDLARRSQVTLLAWAAQARGWFARPLPVSGEDAFDTSGNHQVWRSVNNVAAANGLSPATVALAWALRQEVVAGATVGPVSEREVIESLSALNVRLSPHDSEALGIRSAPPEQLST